jgi:VanZ family protein
MKKTKMRLTLCTSLLVVILTFIWGNSALPGQTSGALSGWVGQFLSKVLPFLATENGLHILRKLAHFSEFAALGFVLYWLFCMVIERKVLQFFLPLLCGGAAACIDETIQIFSPGRHCSIIDVGIDTSGVLTGIIVLFLGYAVYKRIRQKQEDTP